MNNKFYNIIANECEEIYIKNKFNFLRNKKILITGATGILGNYFIGFFLKSTESEHSPKKITLIYKNNLPLYLRFLKKNSFFNLIKRDLTNIKNFKIKKFDYIIHLAGYGQPAKFIKEPLKNFFLNTETIKFLIKRLNKKGIFLNLSSSEVYSGLKGKIKESNIGTTNTDHPRAFYIQGKKNSEIIINYYKKRFKINAKSIRLSLAYGPGNKKNDERVLYQFIKKAIKYKKIKILNVDKTPRCYIYLKDAIIMIINIMFFGKKNIYNVGGNEKTNILDLAKKISIILKAKIIISQKKIKIGSPKYGMLLDTSLYYKEFKKIKLTNLNDGLQKTIKWQKSKQ
jgi:nucleoside-diphosphate-sugar epimerase